MFLLLYHLIQRLALNFYLNSKSSFSALITVTLLELNIYQNAKNELRR